MSAAINQAALDGHIGKDAARPDDQASQSKVDESGEAGRAGSGVRDSSGWSGFDHHYWNPGRCKLPGLQRTDNRLDSDLDCRGLDTDRPVESGLRPVPADCSADDHSREETETGSGSEEPSIRSPDLGSTDTERGYVEG